MTPNERRDFIMLFNSDRRIVLDRASPVPLYYQIYRIISDYMKEPGVVGRTAPARGDLDATPRPEALLQIVEKGDQARIDWDSILDSVIELEALVISVKDIRFGSDRLF